MKRLKAVENKQKKCNRGQLYVQSAISALALKFSAGNLAPHHLRWPVVLGKTKNSIASFVPQGRASCSAFAGNPVDINAYVSEGLVHLPRERGDCDETLRLSDFPRCSKEQKTSR